MQFVWPKRYLKFVEELKRVPAVIALAIGGSHSIGTASDNSDIDLFILTSAIELNSLESWISHLGLNLLDVAFHVNRGFVEDMGYMHQLLMRDGVLLDVTIIIKEEWDRFNVPPTMLIRYDPCGWLSSAIVDCVSPKGRLSSTRRSCRLIILDVFLSKCGVCYA
jgi:Nucleotidyltransferase domain